ncbi:MAG: deoxynucleoside kinase [Bacteroidetes bacterium]|nr:deoxynucleoside kinase [Bacteroidota bacterium]
MNRYIAIEGNIGSGKTTLAKLLAERLGGRLILEEFADNTFLPKFYQDPERYAFPLELSFLADRYKQLLDLSVLPELFQQTTLADYLFVKSRLFAKINLDEAEYELFSQIYRVMDLNLRAPDVLLYLHAPIPVLQRHIQQRGRSYEQDIKDEYLERVSRMYENYLKTLQIPVILIDTSRFHYQDETAIDRLLNLIKQPLAPAQHFF